MQDFGAIWYGPAVHGVGSETRLGGSFTTPAATLLGLRGWSDALEQTVVFEGQVSPAVFFDIEKWLRMLLRSSHLAVEVMLSPVAWNERLSHASRVALVARTLTRSIAQSYLDLVQGPLEQLSGDEPMPDDEVRHLFRTLLTGWNLSRNRNFSLHLGELIDKTGDPDLRNLLDGPLDHEKLTTAARPYLQELESPEKSTLPQKPTDYSFVHSWLVDWRLSTLEDR